MITQLPLEAPTAETADVKKAEKMRLLRKLVDNRLNMVGEYKALIKHTGGLLESSMGYAYSKALNDVIKLLTKEET